MRTLEEVKLWTEGWQFLTEYPAPPLAIAHAVGTDVHEDAPLLYALIRAYQPSLIVELGTRQGTTARTIAQAAREIDAQFITIDPDPGCHGFIAPYVTPRYFEFRQMTGEQAFGSLAPDLLFIDTDPHTYDQTRMWLETWVKDALMPGGVAAFHDTVPARPEIAVGRACREWATIHPDYVWREFPTTYGFGILWKP